VHRSGGRVHQVFYRERRTDAGEKRETGVGFSFITTAESSPHIPGFRIPPVEKASLFPQSILRRVAFDKRARLC